MPKFIVEQYETHVQRYEVEAADKAEAIKKIMGGHGEPKGEQTYLETNEDIGMSLDDAQDNGFSDKELAELDSASLVDRDGNYIFSIRSVKEVK